jgi:hypothetical protein
MQLVLFSYEAVVLLQVRQLERRLEEVEWSPTHSSQQAENLQAATTAQQ